MLRRIKLLFHLAKVVMYSLAFACLAHRAEARVIDTVYIEKQSPQHFHLMLHFLKPMQCDAVQPEADQMAIHILLTPDANAVAPLDNNPINIYQPLTWDAHSGIPLKNLYYDGRGTQKPSVTVKFSELIAYRTQCRADKHWLSIEITPQTPTSAITEQQLPPRAPANNIAAPSPVLPATPAPAPTTTSTPRADWIDSVKIEPLNATQKRIMMRFTTPHTCHSSAMNSNATSLEVKLTPDVTTTPHVNTQDLTADIPPQGSIIASRYRLISPQTATLNVDFSSAVTVQVECSNDRRWIAVLYEEHTKPTSASQPNITASPDTGALMATPARALPAQANTTPSSGVDNPLSNAHTADSYLRQAREAILSGRNEEAINISNQALGVAQDAEAMEALELLGIAQERAGHVALAQRTYQSYLERFPQSEGARRVELRMASITNDNSSRNLGTPRSLQSAEAAHTSNEWQTHAYGELSSYYFFDGSRTSDGDWERNTSSADSEVIFSSQSEKNGNSIATDVRADYDHDLSAEGEQHARFSRLAIEGEDKDSGLSLKVGRQIRYSGGIFNTFDGAHVGYAVSPSVTLHGVAGYALHDYRTPNLSTNQPFYSASVDLFDIAPNTDLTLYGIEQYNDSFVDRQAVGSELYYTNEQFSGYSYLDYDTQYSKLNIASINGTYNIDDSTSVNASAERRIYPLVSTENALIGQGVSHLTDLLNRFRKDDLYLIAEDRSSASDTFTLGMMHALSEKTNLYADIVYSKLNGTAGTYGVDPMPSTGWEGYFSTQAVFSDVFNQDDTVTAEARYGDAQYYTRYITNISTRQPFMEGRFHFNPLFRIDYMEMKNKDLHRLALRPALRMDYDLTDWLQWDVEGGMEWAKTDGYVWARPEATINGAATEYFVLTGLRASWDSDKKANNRNAFTPPMRDAIP